MQELGIIHPCRPYACLQGSKLTLYARCAHEIFAHFGDSSRWDGMVERLVLYDNDARTQVAEVRQSSYDLGYSPPPKAFTCTDYKARMAARTSCGQEALHHSVPMGAFLRNL